MLFDLRGRGRRRTVQAIYLTLAVLMGGGLVLFGIGSSSNVSGGLLDALGLRGGGGGQSTANPLARVEKQAAPRVRANQLAAQGDNYDQRAGAFTAKGRRQLASAAQAWERHLALEPRKADSGVARLMLQAYSPAGLNQPAQ